MSTSLGCCEAQPGDNCFWSSSWQMVISIFFVNYFVLPNVLQLFERRNCILNFFVFLDTETTLLFPFSRQGKISSERVFLITKSKLILLAALQASKSRDKLLGQGIATLFRKPAD